MLCSRRPTRMAKIHPPRQRPPMELHAPCDLGRLCSPMASMPPSQPMFLDSGQQHRTRAPRPTFRAPPAGTQPCEEQQLAARAGAPQVAQQSSGRCSAACLLRPKQCHPCYRGDPFAARQARREPLARHCCRRCGPAVSAAGDAHRRCRRLQRTWAACMTPPLAPPRCCRPSALAARVARCRRRRLRRRWAADEVPQCALRNRVAARCVSA
mmetsp:Transcript_7762/g.19542  ORF Transcript_7762/g.19542 Transcript_7762/m.19542 type:complete len:211 (-) Transcript_7762:709-1341(-)